MCVSFRLLWGAQNARWCLLNSKALPLSTGAPQCGPHAVWNDQLRFRQAEFSNTQSYLLLRFSHRPFQPLFQVQHVVRNSRWMKVTARAREQISSAREDNAVLLPQRCPLLSKPIEELFEWEKQGGQCVSTMLSGLWKSLGLFAPSDLLRSWDRFRVVPSIAVETCRACAKQLVLACFVCVWSCPMNLFLPFSVVSRWTAETETHVKLSACLSFALQLYTIRTSFCFIQILIKRGTRPNRPLCRS